MSQEVFIQVKFKEHTEVGEYNDAIYFTEDEYAVVDQKSIDQIKKKRVDNFVDSIKNPPPVEEPTKEELQKIMEELDLQKVLIDQQLIDLQEKIDEIDSKDP